MSKYNEAKIEILAYFEENSPSTALDVSVARDRSVSCCSTQLGRLYRWGLLERVKIQGKKFYYSITQKGSERLTYLKIMRAHTQAEKWLKGIQRCLVTKPNRHSVPFKAQPDHVMSGTHNISDSFTPEVMDALSSIIKKKTFFT